MGRQSNRFFNSQLSMKATCKGLEVLLTGNTSEQQESVFCPSEAFVAFLPTALTAGPVQLPSGGCRVRKAGTTAALTARPGALSPTRAPWRRALTAPVPRSGRGSSGRRLKLHLRRRRPLYPSLGGLYQTTSEYNRAPRAHTTCRNPGRVHAARPEGTRLWAGPGEGARRLRDDARTGAGAVSRCA